MSKFCKILGKLKGAAFIVSRGTRGTNFFSRKTSFLKNFALWAWKFGLSGKNFPAGLSRLQSTGLRNVFEDKQNLLHKGGCFKTFLGFRRKKFGHCREFTARWSKLRSMSAEVVFECNQVREKSSFIGLLAFRHVFRKCILRFFWGKFLIFETTVTSLMILWLWEKRFELVAITFDAVVNTAFHVSRAKFWRKMAS